MRCSLLLSLVRSSLSPIPYRTVLTECPGVFAGIYATTNGNGEEGTPAYFKNWRYQGLGQAIGIDEYVPSEGQN
jgi:hypothetical protein